MTNKKSEILTWSEIISPHSKNKFLLRSLVSSKDLIFLLVKRDFAKEFKQTILGPLWFIIQPAFQTLVLLFVFGKIGGMGPQGTPQISFYLGGVLIWNVFSENLVKSSEVLRTNAQLFSKVYFPRLVLPLSNLFTTYLKLAVQLSIFFLVYFIELLTYASFETHWTIILFPLYIIIASLSGMGIGLIISSVTTKYWDLRFLVQFGIQLLMFLSTVITPLSNLSNKSDWMYYLISLNPVSYLIEAFRFSFMGSNSGELSFMGLLYSCSFSIIVMIIGFKIFTTVERKFVDTI